MVFNDDMMIRDLTQWLNGWVIWRITQAVSFIGPK